MANESRTIESSRGVQLALHHLGGSGSPLLICHATGFHGRAYQPLANHLAAEFSVWAHDFRGHGASTPPDDGDFSWNGMADDVLAVVDELGGGPMVAVGHSLGGASILLTALEHDVFSSAYLFEPIVFSAEHLAARGENPMSGPARKRRAVFESRQAAIERYGSRPPLSVLDPDALAAYVEYGFSDTDDGQVTLACTPEAEARTFEAEDKMTFDRLVGIEVPVQVAMGMATPERPGPADWAPEIAATITGGELHRYPELTHFGPLEAPERIAADIIEWATAHPAA